MNPLGWARAGAALALAVVLLMGTSAGWAQEPGPTPAPTGAEASSTCPAAQLCLPVSPTPGTAGAGGDGTTGGQTFAGHDPPAHFARSVATMLAVGLILAAFLFMALTGRRLPLGRGTRRRR